MRGESPASITGTAESIAADIVAQTVSDDMSDYEKAEALVDWMSANVELNDNYPDTLGAKQALVLHRASRWGWSMA